MDCARYIRKPTVLAGWLITPLLLILIAALAPRNFHYQMRAARMRNIALKKMIPLMQLEISRFDQFMETYLLNSPQDLPVEDAQISMVNTAAESAGFSISAIRITQETVDVYDKTRRMNIRAEGTGSAKSIANFLSSVQSQDRFIYESQIMLMRTAGENNQFRAEMNLCKIYPAPKEPQL